MIHEEKTQTTCVLRLFGAPLWTVQQAAQQADIAARCRGRGAEVLAALQAETPTGLEKARKALNGRFAAELYGCLLYTSPSPREGLLYRMRTSA